MVVFSLEKFKDVLKETDDYGTDSVLAKFGGSISEKTLEVFDAIMHAEDTDELSGYSDEEVFDAVLHGQELSTLYFSPTFFTESTVNNLKQKKSVRRRRVL